jgi:hypothetical protein
MNHPGVGGMGQSGAAATTEPDVDIIVARHDEQEQEIEALLFPEDVRQQAYLASLAAAEPVAAASAGGTGQASVSRRYLPLLGCAVWTFS